jgi:hypothetical protein
MLSIGKLGSGQFAPGREPVPGFDLTFSAPRPDSERADGLKKMIGVLARPERTIKGKTDPQQRQLAVAS